MRLYAWHDQSGCGWYRIRLPLGQLAAHGHDVTMVLGTDVDVADAARYPLVVGQRMDKFDALPFWRRLRATSRLVYEIDDDVFSTEPVNAMAWGTYSRADVQDAVAHSAEVADLVTVTTEPLADVMRQHNRAVTVLPNHIPAEMLSIERPRRDRLVIGWAGGASHGADLGVVAAQLRRLLDRYPTADLHLIGTDYRPTIRRPARFTRWSDDPTLYYRSIDFDIGLAPLTDGMFNRSKSHIKALEYAALGIPVVATDLPPYSGFVRHGETGFLVRSHAEHDWFRYLRMLVEDADMREEMGAKAKALAAGWTIETGWRLWEDAYRGLL